MPNECLFFLFFILRTASINNNIYLQSMYWAIVNWFTNSFKRTLIACVFSARFFHYFAVLDNRLWNYTKTTIRLRLREYCRLIPETFVFHLKGRPLEITGEGVKIPEKKFLQRKIFKNKILANSPLSKKRPTMSKKKKKSCRQLGLKKKFVHWKFFAPHLPGFLMVHPLFTSRWIIVN